MDVEPKIATLSPVAYQAIQKFIEKQLRDYKLRDGAWKLIVSLYAVRNKSDKETLEILAKYKVSIDGFFTKEEFVALMKEYKEVVYYCASSSFPLSDESWQAVLYTPQEFFMWLCNRLANVKQGSDIYLPYAKLPWFVYNLPACHVCGFESDKRLWAFSRIILDALGINSDITLSDEPHISDGHKFDFVFTEPPIREFREMRSIIGNLCDIAHHSLKEDGGMLCILPMSFCWTSSGWFDFRKTLWERKCSIRLISLPNSTLSRATSMAVCLLHITNDHKGNVVLIDATSDYFMNNRQGNSVNAKRILEVLGNRDELYVWQGQWSDLTDSLKLTPSRYLIDRYLPTPQEGEELIPIGELIEFYGLPRKRYAEGDFIGIRELSSNYLNCDLTLNESQEKTSLPFENEGKRILLAGYMSGKFKVGRMIEISHVELNSLKPEILSFSIRSDKVTEDFLLRSILLPETALQAKMLQAGTVLGRIKMEDFCQIKIIVPSLEKQERICKNDSRKGLTEADRKLLESHEDFRKDIHIKKHAIGQTVFDLNNWMNTLLRAIEEGHVVVDNNAIMGNIKKIRVTEIIPSLTKALNRLQNQIYKFDRGNKMTATSIALSDFICKYADEHKSPIFEYKICDVFSRTDHEDIQDEVHITFPSDALRIILENIISNACNHGFEGRTSEQNRIRIESGVDGTDVILSISNNGNPLHEQISPEDIFTYSKSSKNDGNHFGLGGYEVRSLMREFEGDADVISSPNEEYTVTYRLVFHHTNLSEIQHNYE